jgi:hypothetical protein
MRAAFVVVVLLGVFGGSIHAVQRNHNEFRIQRASYAKRVTSDWYAAPSNPEAFNAIDLPYFLEGGYFRLNIKSSQSVVDVDFWTQDCLATVYLDGRLIYHNDSKCQACSIFHTDTVDRCPLQRLSLDLGQPGKHLLAVKTSTDKNIGLFWIQYGRHAMCARLIALCSGLLLFAMGWSRLRHGAALLAITRLRSFVVRRRAFILIAVLASAFRFVAAPGMLTGDVSRSAMLYAENLVNRHDFHFAQVAPQYAGAAKYSGESHMHKPPGVYYQYAIVRWLLGFSDVYYQYLTRLPGVLGDVIIAWVLMTVIEAQRRDHVGLATAAYFLFGAGVFSNSGIVGRIDSMPLAFLMLALKHIDNRRFSLYLGLAAAWKQLAILVVPWFLFRKATFRGVLWAGVVTLLLCSPYLIDDPKLFFERLVFPQFDKKTDGLAWLRILESFDVLRTDIAEMYRYVMPVFFVSLLVLPWVARPDPWMAVAITYSLFLICAKNVHEHYILWSIPPLLMSYMRTQKLVIGVAMLVGMLSAAFYHEPRRELGGNITPIWAILFALTYAVVVFEMVRYSRRAVSREPSV